MRGRFLGFFLFLAVGLWRLTLRIRVVGDEHRRPLIEKGLPLLHVLWHQRMVLGILRYPWRGVTTMASLSKDGDVIAGFLWWWGFVVARGSSSKGGGEALEDMADVLRGTSRWAALTPDGPRGPARRCKPGIAKLSDALGVPVIPVGTSSTRPRFLRSWDRYMLPMPFSRCVVAFGEPLARAAGESLEEFLARIDAAVDAMTAEADRLCGVVDAPRERAPRTAAA